MAIKRISRKAKWLLAILTIASILTVVNAYVFVSYPAEIRLQPVAPPIIFAGGSGANQTDLKGYTILVELDSTRTNLTLTIHPTWKTNIYIDFARIVNVDSIAYYIAFNITQHITESKITQAKLFLRNATTGQVEGIIDLKSPGFQPNDIVSWIKINGGKQLRLDLLIVFAPGAGDGSNSAPPSVTVRFQLVYSPQNSVSPPTNIWS